MIQVGKPVGGKNLIGRDQELIALREFIKAGQSIVIIAPRRMGKTSIVLELQKQLQEEGLYTGYVDVFSVSDVPNLAHKITSTVLNNRKMAASFRKALGDISEFFKNIEFKQEVEDYSFILNFKEKMKLDPWGLLEESLDFIEHFSEKHHKRMLMIFDEFGDVKKLGGIDIVKLIRSKLQLHSSVSYVFSGSYESVMNDLFVGKDAPFFRMARIVNLENIKEDEFFAYLKKLFKDEKLDVKDEQLERIVEFTKGHPYYTQLYAQELIIKTKLSVDHRLPLHEEVLDQMLLTEKSYLEKVWEDLSSSREHKQILIALLNTQEGIYSVMKGSDVNIPRGLKRLVGMGVLERYQKKYHFTDPLLKLWLQRQFLE